MNGIFYQLKRYLVLKGLRQCKFIFTYYNRSAKNPIEIIVWYLFFIIQVTGEIEKDRLVTVE